MDENHVSRYNILKKTIIVLPIVLILIAAVLKINAKKEQYLTMATFKPVPTIAIPTDMPEDRVFIDLKGPASCKATTQGFAVSALIKDNHIAATIVGKNTRKYVLNDECLYSWTMNETKGVKKCDIAKIMPMIKTLASLKLLSINDMIAAISKLNDTNNELTSVKWDKPQCQKMEVKNTDFVVPTNIIFTEVQAPQK